MDIACLSETCLAPDSSISFSNFHLIHKVCNRRGSSGILICKNFAFSEVDDGDLAGICARCSV